MSIFEAGLQKNTANFEPLSPVSFLRRAAQIVPEHTAIIDGTRKFSYAQFWQRSCQLASALRGRGIGPGDCVAILAGNTPEMLEAHNAIPMMGAVLNSLNVRLDPKTIRFILDHGEAKVLLADLAFTDVLETVVKDLNRDILIVQIGDSDEGLSDPNGKTAYETLLSEGSSSFVGDEPQDEWQALSLLYTSGTTGDPKGCVYHHRGAYLSAMANMNTVGLNRDSVYLWTLPMFHCDGWTFTWAVTAAMATHVCLRQMDPGIIFQLIRDEKVSHMCGAPIVLNMLANARRGSKMHFSSNRRNLNRRCCTTLCSNRGNGRTWVSSHTSVWAHRDLWASNGLHSAGRLARTFDDTTISKDSSPGCALRNLRGWNRQRP